MLKIRRVFLGILGLGCIFSLASCFGSSGSKKLQESGSAELKYNVVGDYYFITGEIYNAGDADAHAVVVHYWYKDMDGKHTGMAAAGTVAAKSYVTWASGNIYSNSIVSYGVDSIS